MKLPLVTVVKNKKMVATWLCIGLAIITVSYLLSYQEKLRRSEARVARTQETLAMLYDLQNRLAVAEAGARLYAATGETDWREAYEEAAAGVERLLPELVRRITEEPGQAPLRRLEEAVAQRLARLHALAAGRGSGRPEAEPHKRAGGQQPPGVIREALAELEQQERELLAQRGARAKARAGRWVTAFSVGTFLSFMLLALVLYFLNQEIGERLGAEEKLEKYQERLRSLASQLTLAEERERRRIAVHLHDNIGQKLALSNIKLGQLTELAAACDNEALETGIGDVRQLLKQTIQDAKSLTFKISSPILYELGLEAAVEWLVEELQSQQGIPAYFEDDHQPKPLAEDVRVLLFQAVNELLVNVVKHSRARHVQVSLWREGEQVKVGVYDDGLGFNAAESGARTGKRNGGFGLFSIRERLKPFAGTLEVESTPGSGTQVIMTVPVAGREPGAAAREGAASPAATSS